MPAAAAALPGAEGPCMDAGELPSGAPHDAAVLNHQRGVSVHGAAPYIPPAVAPAFCIQSAVVARLSSLGSRLVDFQGISYL